MAGKVERRAIDDHLPMVAWAERKNETSIRASAWVNSPEVPA